MVSTGAGTHVASNTYPTGLDGFAGAVQIMVPASLIAPPHWNCRWEGEVVSNFVSTL